MKLPRKKIAIKLVLFLLLGAIVNVAVAWGSVLAFFGGLEPRERFFTTAEPPSWFVQRSAATGLNVTTAQPAPDSRPPWPFLREMYPQIGSEPNVVLRPNADAGLDFVHRTDEAGLPLRCLRCSLHGNRDWNSQFGDDVIVRVGVRLSPSQQSQLVARDRCLPLRPIWPGFAINTIFYAAVLWIVFAAPGMVKRRLRHVRGRCLHCGYDLRGHVPGADSTKCPECGRSQSGETQTRRHAETLA